MTVDGYQTLEDRKNIDEIEQNGPFICDRSDAWLGRGYYFWDTDKAWAMRWGEVCYIRYDKNYVIAHCGLNLTNCFDLLGDVSHKRDIQEVYDVLLKSGKMEGKPRVRVRDCILYLIKQKMFLYNCIRSYHYPKRTDDSIPYTAGGPEVLRTNEMVQICVVTKKDVVLPPFKVIYPEIYLQ